MHVSSSCRALLVFLLVALSAHAAGPPSPTGADTIRALLTRHCAACHGDQAKPKGGFGHVSDLQKLLSRGTVVTGDPERSPLFVRVRDGEMPPGKAHAFTDRDRELLRQWIAAGAPTGPASLVRRLSPLDVQRLVQADLAALPARQRPYYRYLTLPHTTERSTLAQALTKLVNSLSWHPRLTRPTPLADGLVYRIDLRDYRWTARQWERLAARYPYADPGDTLILRADWFVATASRPPAYHDLLTLPSTERGLERLLQLEVATNLEEQTAVRAGFNGSGVARANRVLERHDAAHGAYWRSYDFDGNTGRQNVFEHPLGPQPGPAGFKHAGGEIIFHLPNGLQAYLLVDGNGGRVDKAPGDIVSDPKRPDRLVENGLSCIGCHVTGILPKDDQIRDHVRKNPRAFASELQADVLALYAPAKRMQALVKEDNARFSTALHKLGIAAAEPEPVSAVVLRYEDVVDRQAALEELGITADELAARLLRAGDLGRALGPLLTKGVQRQVFEEAYLRLAESAPNSIAKVAGAIHVHRRAVSALAFSPDGRAFASADQSGSLRVQELASGRGRDLPGHTDAVAALAFTPDGTRLLSVGAGRALTIYDARTGQRLHRLLGHTAGVRAVAATNRWAVTGGEDRTLRIWNLVKGQETLALTGHTGTITTVAISPDGTRILSGSSDRTARLWSVDTGKKLARLPHFGTVHAVAFSPDGKHFATGGSDRMLTVRTTEPGTIVRQHTDQPGPILALALTDALSVYAATSGNVVALRQDGRALVGHDREIRLETLPPLSTTGGTP